MAGYAVTISAKDAATGILDSINKRMEAMTKRIKDAQAPFTRLGENAEKLAKVSGLDKIATGFGDIARAGTESFRSLLRVVEPLAAITGAASLAGMYRLVSAWGEFGQSLGNAAQRASLSADGLYTLQNAARLAGVSSAELTSGMTTLNDNLRNAAFGGAPQFLVALRNLGISYEDLKKQTPTQQLQTLAEALKNVRNPTDRALLTKEIFGGEGMLPFLQKGAEGVRILADRARQLTGSFSEEDVRRARDFAVAQEELKLALTGLGNAAASVLGPALTPLLTDLTGLVVQMRQWTEANQVWLRGEVSARVGEFATWLKGVDWVAVGHGIADIATAVLHVGQHLLEWMPAGQLVLGYFAGAWLTGMLLPIARLTAAIGAIMLTTPPGWITAAIAAIAALGVWEATRHPEERQNINRVLGLDGAPGPHGAGPATDPQSLSYDPAAERPGHESEWTRIRRFLGFGQGASGTSGGAPVALPAGEEARRARVAYDAFRGMGDSETWAAAKVANIQVESRFNERAEGDNHQAYGLGQHHPDRQQHFRQMFGHDIRQGSFDEQVRFYHDDPDAQTRQMRRMQQGNPDMPAYDAAGAVSAMQERPADTAGEMHRRGALAEQMLRRFREQDRARRAAGAPALAPPAVPTTADQAPAAAAVPGASPISAPLGAPVRPAAAPVQAMGEPAPSLTRQGTAGPPGATGQVQMNVRVVGAPTVVTTQASSAIGVRVENHGLLSQ